LTNKGGHRGNSLTRAAQAHERKEIHGGQNRKPIPYEMGVQMPCCVYSEIPPEDIVRGTAEAFVRYIPTAGRSERESNRGRVFSAIASACDDCDSAIAPFLSGPRLSLTKRGTRGWKLAFISVALQRDGYWISRFPPSPWSSPQPKV
jgi:hypothetical protein